MLSSIKPLHTDKAPSPIGPYSQAVESNGLVFISGQIPLDPATNQIAGTTIEEQAQQSLTNLLVILEAAGLSSSNLVKTTVYLRSINYFEAFNRIYSDRLGDAKPARAVVEVSGLPKNVLVEIDAIACR